MGVVEGLPRLTETSGIVMDRGLVMVTEGKVPVNLINVHNHPIVLHKSKTLGYIQHVKKVVSISSPVLPSHKRGTREKDRLLTIEDIPEHTRAILDEDTLSELNAEQIHEICISTLEDPDTFLVPGGHTGQTEVTDQGVDVQGNAPYIQRWRPWPLAKKKAADEQIDKMLEEGVIEPSDSRWASHAVMVTKKDGSHRFCVWTTEGPMHWLRKMHIHFRALMTLWTSLVVQNGFGQWLLVGQDEGKGQAYHCICHQARPISIQGHAFWPEKCPSHFSASDGHCAAGTTMAALLGILRWHYHLWEHVWWHFGEPQTGVGQSESSRTQTKGFQTLLVQALREVLGTHSIWQRDRMWPGKGGRCSELAGASNCDPSPTVPVFCGLLPEIY